MELLIVEPPVRNLRAGFVAEPLTSFSPITNLYCKYLSEKTLSNATLVTLENSTVLICSMPFGKAADKDADSALRTVIMQPIRYQKR